MFKGLFIIGSHLRHEYVVESCKNLFEKVFIIKFQREDEIPILSEEMDNHYSDLYEKHFLLRHQVENRHFVVNSTNHNSVDTEIINVQSSSEMHSEYISELIKEFNADFCLVFGTQILRAPIIGALPKYTMNLHLGLSPWYRGDATLFWPFVMLEPQECGITFHKLAASADSGDIFHQARPQLELGDRLHDVGVKCVLLAGVELPKLITKLKSAGVLSSVKQGNRGKEWLAADFKPQHLALVYEIFDDKIVDWYLKKPERKQRKIVQQDFC